MKLLSKFFLTILLLAIASASWAACPEGTKGNYKGECVPVAGGSTGSTKHWILSKPIGAKPWGYQIVSSPEHPVRYGSVSERFEIRPGDCARGQEWDDCITDRERSELVRRDQDWPKPGDEYWYRWSMYLPDDYESIPRVDVNMWQFHQAGSNSQLCNVAFQFKEIDGGYWVVPKSVITGKLGKPLPLVGREEFIGYWNDIVVHAKWSFKKDGFLKIWANGEQKVDFSGKTMNRPCRIVHNYGAYRAYISRNSKTKSVGHVVYYDGVLRSKSGKGMFEPLDYDDKTSEDDVDLSAIEPYRPLPMADYLLSIGPTEEGGNWRGIVVEIRGLSLGDGRKRNEFSFDPFVEGSKQYPQWIEIFYRKDELPSIDFDRIEACGSNVAMRKKAKISLTFWGDPSRIQASACAYQTLNDQDQAAIRETVGQLDKLFAQGTKGHSDADYWKKIAKIIKDNGANVIQ